MALKNNQTPPCSCCGNKQKRYESWYKIVPERVFYDATYPLNLITSLDIYFICPSCYNEVFKKLIPYKEKVETYWVPQQ